MDLACNCAFLEYYKKKWIYILETNVKKRILSFKLPPLPEKRKTIKRVKKNGNLNDGKSRKNLKQQPEKKLKKAKTLIKTGNKSSSRNIESEKPKRVSARLGKNIRTENQAENLINSSSKLPLSPKRSKSPKKPIAASANVRTRKSNIQNKNNITCNSEESNNSDLPIIKIDQSTNTNDLSK